MSVPSPLLEKIYRRTIPDGTCTIWQGAKSGRGPKTLRYGYIWLEGRPQRVHRVVYKLLTGESPEVVMHLCDRTLCLTPHHLKGGTQRENIADAYAKGRLTGRPRKAVTA